MIGDTPLDVDAAHAVGCTAIGVATGHFDAAALREAGADHVLETLEEERSARVVGARVAAACAGDRRLQGRPPGAARMPTSSRRSGSRHDVTPWAPDVDRRP